MNKLSQLRVLFVLYMVAKTIVEIVLGSSICFDSLESGAVSWLADFFGSPFALSILVIFSNGVLLLVGLLFFHFLLQKKNWARIILLIVGWINIIDALSGILFHTEVTRFLSHFSFGVDWDRILFLDRVTDILGLIYWGYLILVLQFNEKVRHEVFASQATTTRDQQ
jgi:hypothetical protein